MKTSRLVTLAAAAAAATLALGAAPVSGQSPESPPAEPEPPAVELPEGTPIEEAPGFTVSVDPTSGPIGTTITVSGGGCVDGLAEAVLLAATPEGEVTHIVDVVDAPADDAGDWATTLTVYATMFDISDLSEVDVVPGAGYYVLVACLDPSGETVTPIAVADPVPFEVTGDGSAPERPETPEIPEVPESLTPAAPPATAVAGSPSYTG